VVLPRRDGLCAPAGPSLEGKGITILLQSCDDAFEALPCGLLAWEGDRLE
jgi:hypothetical protein